MRQKEGVLRRKTGFNEALAELRVTENKIKTENVSFTVMEMKNTIYYSIFRIAYNLG